MRVIRPASLVLAAVAIVGAVVAWAQGPPDLSADEARDVAVEALAAIDVRADVISGPEADVHRTRRNDEIEVWAMRLAVRAEPSVSLEMKVQRDAGQLVFVDDVVAQRVDPMYLSDEEFALLDAYRDDGVADRWRLGAVLGTLTAILIVAIAAVLGGRRARPLLQESP